MLGWLTIALFIGGPALFLARTLWMMNAPYEHGSLQDPIGLAGVAMFLSANVIVLWTVISGLFS